MLAVRIACLATLLFVGGNFTEAADGVSEPSIERWDRVVCLIESHTDAEGKNSGDAGSAFLLQDDERLILVTAAHVARFTTAKSRLLFRDPDGESHWIILGGLTSGTGEPWRYHEQADLAAMELDGSRVESKRFASLTALAMPLDELLTQTPRRTTKIEIVGFPMLLGVAPNVSPLAMGAAVASRELPVEAKWGHEQIIFAHPVVANGTSGGPAFVTTESPTETRIMGMYMGYQHDQQGHKLAKLVPGRLIADFLRQQTPADSQTRDPARPSVQPDAATDSATAVLTAGS